MTFFRQDKYAFDLYAILVNITREAFKYSDDALLKKMQENAREINSLSGIISTKCSVPFDQ